MNPQRIADIKRQIDGEFARNEKQQYPADSPALPEIAIGRYSDPRFFDLEKKYLWSSSWLIAGHVDELPEIGSYKLWNRVGIPAILIRGKDNKIRAFFNTCRHRGGGLVREATGKAKVLACKFHAWTYDLQGELVFVPDEHDFPGLDKQQNGLVALRCELWGNLIFVNRDLNAPPLLDFLGKAVAELAHFDFDKRRINTILPYELPCNWKVIVDAFQESYHVNATHPKTVAPILDSRGVVTEMWPNGHSIMMVPRRRDPSGAQDFILDAGSKSSDPRHELTRAGNLSFTLFPNIIGTCAEYQFPILSFWPTSLNTTHVDIIITEPENCPDMDPAQAQAIVEQFGVVMAEDMGNAAAIQQSIESGAMRHIQLGWQERRIYQFHEQLDRTIGIENIPPELRVRPMLDPSISH